MIGKHGDRAVVISRFREHLADSPALESRLAELAGKVLGCWCHPEPCHGHALIEALRGAGIEHDAG